MKKKIILMLGLLSMHVSSVAGVAYRQAVNATANPSGLQDFKVVYETLGWPVFLSLTLPVLVLLGYGRLVGLHREKKYWNVAIATTAVSIAMLVLFPFILKFT